MTSATIPMPIAAKIIRGADVIYEGTRYGLQDSGIDVLAIKAAKNAVKIDAQSAADIFYSSSSYFDNRSEYPPTRLPYPTLWMEWTVRRDGLTAYHFAVVTASTPEVWDVSRARGWDTFADSDVHEVISVNGGGLTSDGQVFLSAATGIVRTDRSGNILENEIGTPLQVICPTDRRRDFNEMASALTKPAMLAVGLMNTKNVEIAHKSTASVPLKQQRRHRIPRFEYHIITLPGGRPSGVSGNQSDRATAKHLVRGHFKTYTADAPLMGKHTGTYWWSHSVRGSADAGVIVSDYRLKGAR